MKVLLILADGMRPDSLVGVPEAQDMIAASQSYLAATTVMPSVTLPCHMSLFHSVDPGRHGTTTNLYAPQVRPIRGLCEVLAQAGKTCAFFYNWEPLRDIARPGSLRFSYFIDGGHLGYEKACHMTTDVAVDYLTSEQPDFAFLYLGWPDGAGHSFGWGGEEYQRAVRGVWQMIAQVRAALPDDYTVLVTADHGGHDRTHGFDCPEDMTIPILLHGAPFTPGRPEEAANIIDLAPTVADLLGVAPDADWEGRSLLRKS